MRLVVITLAGICLKGVPRLRLGALALTVDAQTDRISFLTTLRVTCWVLVGLVTLKCLLIYGGLAFIDHNLDLISLLTRLLRCLLRIRRVWFSFLVRVATGRGGIRVRGCHGFTLVLFMDYRQLFITVRYQGQFLLNLRTHWKNARTPSAGLVSNALIHRNPRSSVARRLLLLSHCGWSKIFLLHKQLLVIRLELFIGNAVLSVQGTFVAITTCTFARWRRVIEGTLPCRIAWFPFLILVFEQKVFQIQVPLFTWWW